MKTKQKTVKRSKLSTVRMVAGQERKYDKVIDGDVLKEWVGVGWIDIGKATSADRERYPTVVD